MYLTKDILVFRGSKITSYFDRKKEKSCKENVAATEPWIPMRSRWQAIAYWVLGRDGKK